MMAFKILQVYNKNTALIFFWSLLYLMQMQIMVEEVEDLRKKVDAYIYIVTHTHTHLGTDNFY